ncbi:thiol:disulfide interchange protein DsbD [Microbulbifer donghaiensis]|uniref:Thiol:disulfide interchange protein DsbD n=1 Tax=Microbulbifer donghaiensis TaxID=494016 RepID=A0A1M5CBR6_9GAMM|nr:thioredoxin family protein [Microbulbifer donghaiensis]SHF52116.1 thiol:disulfide interchange protein DsbD [Microbulbifer donghaiensis]
MSIFRCGVKAILFAAFVILAHPAGAQSTASGDHVRVRWLAPDTFAQGNAETIGFYFEVDPGWHVYWRNAGDSGAAPRFDIRAVDAEVGDIQWPFPVRLPIEHLTNLGYEGDVTYLFALTPKAGAERVALDVNLEWLVCKVDCIPGFGTMQLSRPVAQQANWNGTDRALRDRFQARVPGPQEQSPWRAVEMVEAGAGQLRLAIEPTGEGGAVVPQVFPVDGELLAAAEPRVESAQGRVDYTFTRVPGAPLPTAADFVISDGQRAWLLDAIPVGAAAQQWRALWLLLLAAFAGGMILNLMPCVFPVLSIKLFGLMGPGATTSSRVGEGLRYSAGVLATFAGLGAMLLLLRAGGAAVGWGFQLQSAPVVLLLILLFWLMGLSFSGVFEFGHRLMNMAGRSHGGSFATGVLAVFVAAPCTGPFMGAALGAAVTLPAAQAMAIFLALGAGLAAPFLLLCASPAVLNRLPAPGPWMEKLRQLLAFPLYATVIWLLWVLGRILGESGWLIGALLLLAVVFALWLGKSFGRGARVAAYMLVAVATAAVFGALRTPPPVAPQSADRGWHSYDKLAIEQALAQNRPVFIDYTAAWCITCQVNKKLVLESASVMDLFRANDVLLIRADWTTQDAEITAALSALGRNSVPVYAWYAPGAREPELLPQILQERMIAALFTESAKFQYNEDEKP